MADQQDPLFGIEHKHPAAAHGAATDRPQQSPPALAHRMGEAQAGDVDRRGQDPAQQKQVTGTGGAAREAAASMRPIGRLRSGTPCAAEAAASNSARFWAPRITNSN